VLGLGDIGPEAGLPVMEGKALLFKFLGGVDAVPLCLRTKDPDEFIRTVQLLEPSFGGINLEDIAAGERTLDVSQKYGLSQGRISQLRRRLHDDWEEFCAVPHRPLPRRWRAGRSPR
jgi:hypothetical protein